MGPIACPSGHAPTLTWRRENNLRRWKKLLAGGLSTKEFDPKSASKSARNLPFWGPCGGPGEIPGGSRGGLEGSWGTSGGLGNSRGDLEGSWADLGPILEPSWGPRWGRKSIQNGSQEIPTFSYNFDFVLDPSWNRFGAQLGPKTAPRRPPKSSRNELRRGSAKSLKSTTVISGPQLGPQNGSKTDLKTLRKEF